MKVLMAEDLESVREHLRGLLAEFAGATSLDPAVENVVAFSGSGNSPNIVKAITRARELGVTSFAVLGFTGGKCLGLADHPIYFPVHDMQVAEDLQVMVGHMAMKWLSANPR